MSISPALRRLRNLRTKALSLNWQRRPVRGESLAALFIHYVAPLWKSVVFIVTLSVLLGALTSLRPLVVAPALDAFTNPGAKPAESVAELDLNNLGATLLAQFGLSRDQVIDIGLFTALFYVGITALIALFGVLSQRAIVSSRSSLNRNLVTDLHRHLLTLPLSFFTRRNAGEFVSRLTEDCKITANALDSVGRGFLKSLSQTAIALTLLVRTDAVFASVVLTLGIVHLGITKWLGGRVYRRTREYLDEMGLMKSTLFETFVGIRVVKSFAAERYEASRMFRAAERYRQRLYSWRVTTYYEVPIRMVAESLVIATVLFLAFYAVSAGRMNLAGAAMFFYLAQQVSAPINELFRHALHVQQIRGSAESVMHMFRERSPQSGGTRDAPPLESSIELSDVRFEYEEGREVLHGINMSVNKGEFVALVGPSGAGKSTVADLMLRMYDVSSGCVLYDGVDVREINERKYRKRFGVVAQECLLFNGTIRENIVYSRPEDGDALREAVWAANLDDVVERFPAGLETVVGDRGIRVSGGQRQRIAIARAMYGRPQILILDEATSALDSESELAVQQAIDKISTRATIVAIAHRLSTVKHADKIVVLNEGCIDSIGTHDTLLRDSVLYQRLCKIQFGASPAEDEGSSIPAEEVVHK